MAGTAWPASLASQIRALASRSRLYASAASPLPLYRRAPSASPCCLISATRWRKPTRMFTSGRQQPPSRSAVSWNSHQVSWQGPTPCIWRFPPATRRFLYSRYFARVTSPAPTKIVGSCPKTLRPLPDSFSSRAQASGSRRPARFASSTTACGRRTPSDRRRSISLGDAMLNLLPARAPLPRPAAPRRTRPDRRARRSRRSRRTPPTGRRRLRRRRARPRSAWAAPRWRARAPAERPPGAPRTSATRAATAPRARARQALRR